MQVSLGGAVKRLPKQHTLDVMQARIGTAFNVPGGNLALTYMDDQDIRVSQ
jgi:hypothetical protein